MSTVHLLVVEDEKHLAEVIRDNLEFEGYEVEVTHDGVEALECIRSNPPALVLLDVMLPGMDGFEICDTLRREKNDVPILFLTARCNDEDRVRGLELGGDDFLGKPFDLRELILRVGAILKRTRWFAESNEEATSLTLGDRVVDFESYTVRSEPDDEGSRDGQSVEIVLSAKEAMILRCLHERAGEVVSRDEILDRVWGYDAFPTTRSIDNFIVRLRRVLEPDPKHPRYIHTIRGVGYRLTP